MLSVIKILLPTKLHENSSILESIEKSGLRILDTLFEVFAEKNMLAVNAFFVFSTLLFDNNAFNSIISKNSNKFQKCCSIYSQISKNIGGKLLRLLLLHFELARVFSEKNCLSCVALKS